jgi:hypothetical protein
MTRLIAVGVGLVCAVTVTAYWGNTAVTDPALLVGALTAVYLAIGKGVKHD